MKSYLLTYNKELGTTEHIEKILNSIPEIDDWRSDLPHVYYLRSDRESHDLAASIKRSIRRTARFLVVEVTENSDGCVTGATWPFLRIRGQRTASPQPYLDPLEAITPLVGLLG